VAVGSILSIRGSWVLGSFQKTDRRPKLFAVLEEFLRELGTASLFKEILLGGSFVTNKAAPNDIDLILVVPSGHDWTRELKPFEYNLLSSSRLRKMFGFDVLIAEEGSAEYSEYLILFQAVRDDHTRRKGLVRLQL
jgi:hypothetical protein